MTIRQEFKLIFAIVAIGFTTIALNKKDATFLGIGFFFLSVGYYL